MNKISTASASAESGRPASRNAEIDPLLFYESQSTGKEFDAFIPSADERRKQELRRNEVVLKNWRGVPTERGEKASSMIRYGISTVKDFETQRVLDSERMFIVVLSTMTLLLGSMFTYFVMNFQF